MLPLKVAIYILLLLSGLMPSVYGGFLSSWLGKAVPSKHHLLDKLIPVDNEKCQIQHYKTAVCNSETLRLKKIAPGHIKLEHYQLYSMKVSNCQIDKYEFPAINDQSYEDASPSYRRKNTLAKELSDEYGRITGDTSARVVFQMMKSTKAAWLYILLITLLCQFAISKLVSLIFDSSKDTSQQDDQSNNDSEQASCVSQTSGERKRTSKDQADIIQKSSMQSSSESTSENEQHPKSTESQGTDRNQGNEQGCQHQGNSQQPNGDDGDESNGNQDSQDKQRADGEPDESDELDEEEQINEGSKAQEGEAIEDGQREEDEDLQQNQDETDTAQWPSLVDEPLIVKGIIVWYPAPREKRLTSYPQQETTFDGPILGMLKSRNSSHLSKKGPSSSNGFVSVDRLLPENAKTRFKKAYKKKCKQQQDECIKSREDFPVFTESYQINLLDCKFYCNESGTENLYDGPEEIAPKLGLEYRGSSIVTVYPSSTAVGSSLLPRSLPQVKSERVMSEDGRAKSTIITSGIQTLAAYKEKRRRKALECNQS